MNFRIQTKYDEMCLCVKISCAVPTKVRIKIYDEEKPKIVFTDRYKTVYNSETFYIRLPITSKCFFSRYEISLWTAGNISLVAIDCGAFQYG